MKTRWIGFIACLMIFCTTIFSGCGLITLNREKYLNETVASMVDKNSNERVKIKKKELIEAYDTYKYYFTQYYGQSEEEALKSTLDLLVNRKVTVREAKRLFEADLTEKEKTYIWQQTADALENKFKEQLDKILGTSNGATSQGATSAADTRKFDGYTPKADLSAVTGSLEIVRLDVPTKEIDSFQYDIPHDFNNEEDKNLIWTNFFTYVNQSGSSAYKKAFNKYLQALKADEKGLNLTTDTASIFLREIDKLYLQCYENYLISKYDEYFTNYTHKSTVTIDQMLNLYTAMVSASYTQYVTENDSSYETNMQSDSTKIYYYREKEEDTKFFQVAHILFKFDDTTKQSAEYKELINKKNNGGFKTEDEYHEALSLLASKIKPIIRQKNDKGEYVVDSTAAEVSPYDLAADIKREVELASSEENRFTLFNDFIYRYNDDPGMINAQNSYTIGVNKSQAEEGEEFKVYSNYVAEFTDMAVELYKQGEVGAVSTPVITENGIHVLFYVGELENAFQGIDEDFSLTNDETNEEGLTPIEVLHSTYVNRFLGKTYFDVIYDTLMTDKFAVFQNLNIAELKAQYNITYYGSAYADLIK